MHDTTVTQYGRCIRPVLLRVMTKPPALAQRRALQ